MPPILDPNRSVRRQRLKLNSGTTFGDLRSANFSYTYPNDLDLRPAHPLHEKILDFLWAFAQQAQVEMSHRHGYWRERDKVLKAFATLPSAGRRPNERNPDNTEPRIIMPVSYVALETLLTYMSSSFLQEPIFKYEGVGPEDVLGGHLMTAVVQRHMHRYGVGMNLHTAWRDMFAYGLGAVHPHWKTTYGSKTIRSLVGIPDEVSETFFVEGEERTRSPYQILFEGNALDNIDPYRLILDPNAAVGTPDGYEGEFAGWWDSRTLRHLQRWEVGNEGFFNAKYLQIVDGRSGLLRSKSRRENDRSRAYIEASNPVDLFWMYVDLIPKEWELGSSKDPEVWLFVVAGDKVIVKAEPTNLGRIPIIVGAPDTDGYTTTPTSRLEAVDELQKLVDFLYSSHVANIKQVLYDSIVYDPTLINSEDLNDPRPGKRIRFRKKAWGRTGVKDSIFQLKVEDVTQANVNEALLLSQMIHDSLGTQDPLRGQAQPRTTRISAREAGNLQGGALSRLAHPALLISIQFMQPLARIFASHTQQFMSQELYIRTTGELEQKLREEFGITDQRIKVNPLDLVIDYDISAHDAVVPGSEDVSTWTQLLQVLTSSPEIAQGFDLLRIVRHIGRQLGAKNVDDFIRRNPPQVLPDQQVLQQEQAGNIIPIGGDGAL